MLERYRLIKRIVRALNYLPDTRARGKSPAEMLASNEPDIVVVVKGFAVFLTVIVPLSQTTDAQELALNQWYARAQARVAVIDSIEGAVAIIEETAERVQSLYDYQFEKLY